MIRLKCMVALLVLIFACLLPSCTERHEAPVYRMPQAERNPYVVIQKITAKRPPATHTVKAGENLSSIAEQHGLRWEEIFVVNQDSIKHPDHIEPGQEFLIPEKNDVDEEEVKAVAKAYAATKPNSPFFYDNPGRDPFGNKGYRLAFSLFEQAMPGAIPEEVKAEWGRKIEAGEFVPCTIEKGEFFAQMVWGRVVPKVRNNVIARFAGTDLESIDGLMVSAIFEGMIWDLKIPDDCTNFAWIPPRQAPPDTPTVPLVKLLQKKKLKKMLIPYFPEEPGEAEDEIPPFGKPPSVPPEKVTSVLPLITCKPDGESWVCTGRGKGAHYENRMDDTAYFVFNGVIFPCDAKVCGGILKLGYAFEMGNWWGDAAENQIEYDGKVKLNGVGAQYFYGNNRFDLRFLMGEKEGSVRGRTFYYRQDTEIKDMKAYEGTYQRWGTGFMGPGGKMMFNHLQAGFRIEDAVGTKTTTFNGVTTREKADDSMYRVHVKAEVIEFNPDAIITAEVAPNYRANSKSYNIDGAIGGKWMDRKFETDLMYCKNNTGPYDDMWMLNARADLVKTLKWVWRNGKYYFFEKGDLEAAKNASADIFPEIEDENIEEPDKAEPLDDDANE